MRLCVTPWLAHPPNIRAAVFICRYTHTHTHVSPAASRHWIVYQTREPAGNPVSLGERGESAGRAPLALQHRAAFYKTIRINNLKADVKTHKSLSHNQHTLQNLISEFRSIWLQTPGEVRGMKACAVPPFHQFPHVWDERIHNSYIIYFPLCFCKLDAAPAKRRGAYLLLLRCSLYTYELRDEIWVWLF